MKRIFTALAIVSCSALTASSQEESEDVGNPALAPLHQAIAHLVKRHYPKATSHVFKDKIHFEHSTRLFITRAMAKVPRGQQPPLVEARGPMAGGIWCDIWYHDRRLEDRPPYPRSEGVTKRQYFTEHIYYPNDKRHRCHMVVTLRLPSDTNETTNQFVEDFRELLDSFGKHLSSRAASR